MEHLTTLQLTGKLSVLCKFSRKDYDVCKRAGSLECAIELTIDAIQKSTELMFNRPICTRWDLMKLNITTEMNEKSTAKFKVGDKVSIRSYSKPRVKWAFGTIFGKTGLAHYDVTVDRKHHTRHVDQIRRTLYEEEDIEHGQNEYQVSDESPPTRNSNQHWKLNHTIQQHNQHHYGNQDLGENHNSHQPYLSFCFN
jgi:hypothetical protein